MTDFSTWFEQKYIDWLARRGRRGSIREFSDCLKIDQKMVANWMRGAGRPGPNYADQICVALDFDMTIYDVLGLPRPDKELLKIKFLWPDLTEREKIEVGKVLERIEQRVATEGKRGPIHTSG